MAHAEPSTSGAISEASSILLNNYLSIVAFTIFYYDYCLTLPREINHFWKTAKLSAVSVLFVMNRYLGFLGQIPVFVEYFGHLPQQLQQYHQFYAVIAQVIVGLILIMRTYALYSRSRRVLACLLSLAAILAIGTVVAETVKTTAVTANITTQNLSTSIGCDLSLSAQQGLRSAIGWLSMLCLDTTIFVMTVVKTCRVQYIIRQGLLNVLRRDGTLYYAILVVANLANILTFLAPHIGNSYRGLATAITNAVSSMLISRICLNLRDPQAYGLGRLTERHHEYAMSLVTPSSMPTIASEMEFTQRWRSDGTMSEV